MNSSANWSQREKVELFRRLFSGREDAYGTYDPRTGRVWQVKRPVTDFVLLNHLRGHQPFGIYMLEGDTTSVAVADFDQPDLNLPVELVRRLRPDGVHGYIERSKSKGYHVWFFFRRILAWKPRLVLKIALEALGASRTEVFPKQDRLLDVKIFGNFINAPLFGRLVSSERTVFVDESGKRFADQWAFLGRIEMTHERALDVLLAGIKGPEKAAVSEAPSRIIARTFGLTPCAQIMLREGVSSNQRVACFRLACQLRKAGLPFDAALEVLKSWRAKNHPPNGTRIITSEEVFTQTRCAYAAGLYQSCGCEDEPMRSFCDSICPIDRGDRSAD
jgi:hypothetical protein